MPKPATGSVRQLHGVYIARVRVNASLRTSFPLPTCSTEATANERALLLAVTAKRMQLANTDQPLAVNVLKKLSASTPDKLRAYLKTVEGMIGGELVPIGAPTVPTFRAIAEQWTSGKLAERFPDQVRIKRSVRDDVSRLAKYVLPVIGDIPIDRVSLEHAEQVMRALPASLATATRAHIGQLVVRALALAVYPLRLIERSPIPKGFLPGASKPKALAYLYPSEDARLMGCTAVPLEHRLLWGFLAREGMREGEAVALTWADVDLQRGAVRLDKNKSDDPRAWALSAGVAAALRAYKTRYRPTAGPSDPVLPNPLGRAHDCHGMAERLREHLRAIGLAEERPELFVSTAERRQMRVHDLRGTFVTVSLANGRSESWISDRTGHRSSVMLARYKRNARTFGELNLGELAPLDAAIPELANGYGLATTSGNHAKPNGSGSGCRSARGNLGRGARATSAH